MISDGIYTVFKTLIKVPVYTAIAYIIFNCFAFSVAYYRMLGVSHAVQMMVMEDNFLTKSDIEVLNEEDGIIYNLTTSLTPWVAVVDCANESGTIDIDGDSPDEIFDKMSGYRKVVCRMTQSQNFGLFSPNEAAKARDIHCNTSPSSIKRTQFGHTRIVGLLWEYRPVFPLLPSEQVTGSIDGQAVGGLDNFNSDTPVSRDPTNIDTKQKTHDILTVKVPMVYKIPGLKYYPDLPT